MQEALLTMLGPCLLSSLSCRGLSGGPGELVPSFSRMVSISSSVSPAGQLVLRLQKSGRALDTGQRACCNGWALSSALSTGAMG